MEIIVNYIKEIVVVAVGAIIAFGFSVLTNFLARRHNVNSFKKKLIQELKQHETNLKDVLNDTRQIIKCYSPIWELLISSAVLQYFCDNDYKEITKTYIEIKKLAEYESSIKDCTGMKDRIIKEREKVLKTLQNTLVYFKQFTKEINK